MKDSGKRQEFTTGAVRDAAGDKPMLSLVSPFAMRRLGTWLTLGARKYAPRNWEKGIPFSRVLDSLERHVLAYKEGLHDEDHLAAVMTNAMFLAHYEEMIRRGILPAGLDDRPNWTPLHETATPNVRPAGPASGIPGRQPASVPCPGAAHEPSGLDRP